MSAAEHRLHIVALLACDPAKQTMRSKMTNVTATAIMSYDQRPAVDSMNYTSYNTGYIRMISAASALHAGRLKHSYKFTPISITIVFFKLLGDTGIVSKVMYHA